MTTRDTPEAVLARKYHEWTDPCDHRLGQAPECSRFAGEALAAFDGEIVPRGHTDEDYELLAECVRQQAEIHRLEQEHEVGWPSVLEHQLAREQAANERLRQRIAELEARL